MNSCNVLNRNVHIVNSISRHINLLNFGNSDGSCNISKPEICKSSNKSVCKMINDRQVVDPVRESLVVNHSKPSCKRSFNVSSHKYDVIKSLMN